MSGCVAIAGPPGPPGPTGPPGAASTVPGPSGPATIVVGTTTTGAPGSSASVTNAGTSDNTILNFVIPRGDAGPTGPAGATGPMGPAGSQGPPGAGTIQDEGVALTQRSIVNFVGTGVAATDDVANSCTVITIPGASGGHVIAEEGSALTARPTLNFTGAEITASDDSLNNRTNIAVASNPISAINAQTGTSYTLQAGDHNRIVTLNNAGAITLTVPAGLGAGFSCLLVQLGAGKVTFTGFGTTINQRQAWTKTTGQYAVASLVAYAVNIFVLSGDLGT